MASWVDSDIVFSPPTFRQLIRKNVDCLYHLGIILRKSVPSKNIKKLKIIITSFQRLKNVSIFRFCSLFQRKQYLGKIILDLGFSDLGNILWSKKNYSDRHIESIICTVLWCHGNFKIRLDTCKINPLYKKLKTCNLNIAIISNIDTR